MRKWTHGEVKSIVATVKNVNKGQMGLETASALRAVRSLSARPAQRRVCLLRGGGRNPHGLGTTRPWAQITLPCVSTSGPCWDAHELMALRAFLHLSPQAPVAVARLASLTWNSPFSVQCVPRHHLPVLGNAPCLALSPLPVRPCWSDHSPRSSPSSQPLLQAQIWPPQAHTQYSVCKTHRAAHKCLRTLQPSSPPRRQGFPIDDLR